MCHEINLTVILPSDRNEDEEEPVQDFVADTSKDGVKGLKSIIRNTLL